MSSNKDNVPKMPYVLNDKGLKMKRLPTDHTCSTCNAKAGTLHGHACDEEVCPKCKGYLIECTCKFTHYLPGWHAEP